LLIFAVAVIKGQEKALEFQFNKEFYFMSGPGESKGLTPQELRLLYVVNTGSELVEWASLIFFLSFLLFFLLCPAPISAVEVLFIQRLYFGESFLSDDQVWSCGNAGLGWSHSSICST